MRNIFAFGMLTFGNVVLKRRKTESEVWMRNNELSELERYKICLLWKKECRGVYFKRVTDLYVNS
jgi:hypothetical protein